MSLVEMVIVLVILGITVVPLGRLATRNLSSGGDYSIMTRALYHAQERMEEIVADYSSPSRGYTWVITNWSGVSDTPDAGLTRTVSISGVASLNGVSYVELQVRVTGSRTSPVILTIWLVDL
jgi:type II secretory pathway pseudopilin PulG